MNPITDSHAHVITADQSRYPRLNEPAARALPAADADTLLAQMHAQGVTQALLVQRGTIYGDDNSYVRDAAARTPHQLAAVCGIDATKPGCAEAAKAWHAQGAVGFRLMARTANAGLSWLTGDTADPLWSVAADRAIPMCVHLFPWNREPGIAALLKLIARHPNLPILLDHLTNGPIDPKNNGIDPLLTKLADHQNVCLKFTTIPLGRLKRDNIDATTIIHRFVAVFGADRLMWGSDITQSIGTYAELVALGREAVQYLPPHQQTALLSTTCRRFYQLGTSAA